MIKKIYLLSQEEPDKIVINERQKYRLISAITWKNELEHAQFSVYLPWNQGESVMASKLTSKYVANIVLHFE